MKSFLNYFFLLFIIICLSFGLYSKSNMLQKIQNSIEYRPNELILAIFLNLGDCLKCLQLPLSTVKCSFQKLNKNDDSLKFKALVIVKCNREIEIKRFRKIYNWDGYCYFNNGSVQKELGLPNNVWFSIFYKDSCLYYNTYDNSYEQPLNCDSLTNLLNKIIIQLKGGK